jgi:hypothetical protein
VQGAVAINNAAAGAAHDADAKKKEWRLRPAAVQLRYVLHGLLAEMRQERLLRLLSRGSAELRLAAEDGVLCIGQEAQELRRSFVPLDAAFTGCVPPLGRARAPRGGE